MRKFIPVISLCSALIIYAYTPVTFAGGGSVMGDTARGAARGAIIGGIAGDAGKGAAAGAIGGALIGDRNRRAVRPVAR